jgi:hypothetical protein
VTNPVAQERTLEGCSSPRTHLTLWSKDVLTWGCSSLLHQDSSRATLQRPALRKMSNASWRGRWILVRKRLSAWRTSSPCTAPQAITPRTILVGSRKGWRADARYRRHMRRASHAPRSSDDYEVQIKTIEAHLRRLGLTEERSSPLHSFLIKGWKASTRRVSTHVAIAFLDRAIPSTSSGLPIQSNGRS